MNKDTYTEEEEGGKGNTTISPMEIRTTIQTETDNAKRELVNAKKESETAKKELARVITESRINNTKNVRAKALVHIALQYKYQENCCRCYTHESNDNRCCGVCYCCCPKEKIEEQCNCCPNDFSTYWHSGLVQTHTGYGNKDLDENGVCCCICFPIKFAFFFPCCLGSIVNNCINYVRKTNGNYLF